MRKIDFTCKKVTLKDLVQCNYNLNESEYQIFAELIKSKKGLSVKDLVEKVNKDRTTVQKILSKLISRRLLIKRQINLDRGFMFVYFSKNKDEIISEIEANVNMYFKHIEDNLNKWKKKINL
ncbi:MAG: helix-turn-helix domain-containing protein [Nanoarchaeota archaeon]